MPDPKIEDRSDAMEDDLHKLEDHIADAEKKLEARKQDAAIAGGADEKDLAERERTGGGGDDDAAGELSSGDDDAAKDEDHSGDEPADSR